MRREKGGKFQTCETTGEIYVDTIIQIYKKIVVTTYSINLLTKDQYFLIAIRNENIVHMAQINNDKFKLAYQVL